LICFVEDNMYLFGNNEPSGEKAFMHCEWKKMYYFIFTWTIHSFVVGRTCVFLGNSVFL